MRVLVTGAAGFIGSHLSERLLERGDEVHGVDNALTGRLENFPSGGRFSLLDITARAGLYSVANAWKPELVIHCAASYSDPNLWHRDTDTNVSGTINAALVAKHHGARLAYFQTSLPPISSYAITKIAGEQFIGLSGVDAVTFRLANVYGPRNLSGPIPTFFKRLSAGEPCTVVDTRRDMVFIDDLVDGVMAALDAGVSGRFDMCSGSDFAIASLFEAVASALDSDEDAREVPAGDDDVPMMILDPAPAAEAFRWRATTDLHDGVGAAVEWYREHGVEQTFTHLKVAG